MTDHSGREGQQLGNYRLLRLLGKGGFAEVYLGEHLHLGTQAAIKVLKTHLENEDIVAFRDEARLIASLTHAHIVRVLDFAVEHGTPFLVMEYAAGGSLRDRHPAGTQLPLDIIVAYVQQVASALQYAHEQHLIHCDIKPENMLLGSQDEVLLSDFGLAILASRSQSYSTKDLARKVAGTLLYLAPEQLQGKPQPASDQYALGIVVYEWLVGMPPFRGTSIEVAAQQLSAPPPPLLAWVPNLWPSVEEVVLRALAKDPEQRFASVQDFANALERAGQSPPTYSSTSALDGEVRSFLEPTPTWKRPSFLTSFIGRKQEVVAASALLRQPEVRLLTLTGTGGVGKTRLSLEVATNLFADFAAGACFVSLAPISDPDLLIPAIAQALGLRETGDRPLSERLRVYLQDQQCLLVLDNFEQVVAGAPHIADLLTSCPRLKVLVTSRAVLRIYGEREFPVSPLPVPDLSRLPTRGNLTQYAAVRLFVERTQAIKPGFELNEANLQSIAGICARLDGLPLAIELAAARMKLLHPQALLARLEHRLQLLTSGAQNMPLRQQTLYNTIAWSYNLLSAREQKLFRRLSAFADGCTLEAIEFLCNELDNGAADVLDDAESLVNKSLLQQISSLENEPRLTMLETIREFGLECLQASGEMEAVRRAYTRCYLALAEEAKPHLTAEQQAIWLTRLEREHQNLRVALNWAVEQDETEIALRLCVAQWWYWVVHAHLREGRQSLEKALAGKQGAGRDFMRLRGRALYAISVLSWIQGNYDRGEEFCQESLALYRELEDQKGIGSGLMVLGRLALSKRDISAARVCAEESLTILRAVGDTWGVAYSLESLARVVLAQGEDMKALQLLQESLALFREVGDKSSIAWILMTITRIIAKRRDQTISYALLEEAVALCKELGNKWGVAGALGIWGQIAFEQGDVVTARSQLEESLSIHREVGDQRGMARSLLSLANVVAFQGDTAAARKFYEESLAIASTLNHEGIIATCLVGLGGVVMSQQPAWAARLWGKAEALRLTADVSIPAAMQAYYKGMVATVSAQLGEKAFASAWAQGKVMALQQVIAAREPVMLSESLAAKPPTVLSNKTRSVFPAGLTAREVEVLRLVSQGLTDAQIAEKLAISPRTVNTHLTSIYNKLGVDSRTAAMRFAMEHRLA